MSKDCTTCTEFYPKWEGNKNTAPQPAWCFLKRIPLTDDCIKNGCEKKKEKAG